VVLSTELYHVIDLIRMQGYKVGKACREKLLKTASDADKPTIRRAITRDDTQLRGNSCK
jgi:hypothetical protein